MANKVVFSDEARKGIEAGIDLVANAAKVTLGPLGRNVVLESRRGAPQIINDGVTIVRAIEPEDETVNIGARLIKEVCKTTNDAAGDGTTTAAVLAQSLVKEGLKNIAAGANPMNLKKGIDLAVKEAVVALKAMSVSVNETKDIENIASISSGNNKEVGKLIAQAMDEVGEEGVISVEESRTFDTELEVVEGTQFDRGYISPYFITDPSKMEVYLSNPFIFIMDKKLLLLNDALNLLNSVVKAQRPLLIIADSVEGEALASLIVNHTKGVMRCCAVKAPGYGDRKNEYMEDLAILTGAEYVSESRGHKLDLLDASCLGEALSVRVTNDKTTIVVGDKTTEQIKARIEALKNKREKSTSQHDKDALTDRIGRLSGGVALIKVGAATETELKDKKLRLEDAINATKSAVEEGYVPGGGVALFNASLVLASIKSTMEFDSEDQKTGYDSVIKALQYPVKQIVENAGLSGDVVTGKLKEEFSISSYLNSPQTLGFGFNAANSKFTNLISDGIIDPTKVERCALVNAASVASMFLTTEAVIVSVKDQNKQAVPQQGGQFIQM